MKKSKGLITIIASLGLIIGWTAPSFAASSELVDLLVKNLGVTSQQAAGGAGAIFNTAKKDMAPEDFSKVSDAMPEVKSLMSKAPKIEKSTGLLSSASSMLGDHTGTAGKMAGLSDSFSKLGMSKEMVGQFIPLILNYADTKGGSTISSLLKAALQ